MDRRLGNNVLYNRIYDLGYDVNIKIVDDGFERTFKDEKEAIKELRKLGPKFPDSKLKVFRKNVAPFLTKNKDDSIYFLAKTKSVVYYWEV
jgi:hypothetical protein